MNAWPATSAWKSARSQDCITMVQQTSGTDARTGRKINRDYANWTTHPNNPMAMKAAE